MPLPSSMNSLGSGQTNALSSVPADKKFNIAIILHSIGLAFVKVFHHVNSKAVHCRPEYQASGWALKGKASGYSDVTFWVLCYDTL